MNRWTSSAGSNKTQYLLHSILAAMGDYRDNASVSPSAPAEDQFLMAIGLVISCETWESR